jgi:hypothetical protein
MGPCEVAIMTPLFTVHVNVVSVDAVTVAVSFKSPEYGKLRTTRLPTGKLLGADVVKVAVVSTIDPPVICHVLFVKLFTHRFELRVEK